MVHFLGPPAQTPRIPAASQKGLAVRPSATETDRSHPALRSATARYAVPAAPRSVMPSPAATLPHQRERRFRRAGAFPAGPLEPSSLVTPSVAPDSRSPRSMRKPLRAAVRVRVHVGVLKDVPLPAVGFARPDRRPARTRDESARPHETPPSREARPASRLAG